MKKQLIFILIIIALAIAYYMLTPKQQRLGDDYVPENLELQETEKPLIEDDSNIKIEDLKIYYYKSDDANCETLIETKPEKFDDRYRYKEINAITTLLSGDVPQGYKSAIIAGTVLNQLRISKGVASVDLSSFLTLPSRQCGKEARIDQITKTLEQFDSFDTIQFLVDGKLIE